MVKITSANKPSGIHKSVGKPKQQAAKSGKRDSVKVSDAAGLRARAKVMLEDLPDVRLDEIEQIRDALESGSYEMNNKAIASHIVRNALSEHAWG
ncbi:MAG: flagellar biosynthesis anti-sigma factor FlgM [Ghiorsea sp.]